MIEVLLAIMCLHSLLINLNINRINKNLTKELRNMHSANREIEAILRKEANKNK